MSATPRPTEAACTTTIIAGALAMGYFVHHCRPSQHQSGRWGTAIQGTPGFPDLVIAGFGHCLAVELKRKPNRVEPAQQAWIDRLAAAGVHTGVVWVPEGQDAFLATLAGLKAAAA